MSKNEIIKKVYNDPSGFGSLKNTLADAREIDKTITIDDVKKWFDDNVEQKKQLPGSNSFVPNGNKYEYQIDLFFIKHLQNQQYEIGMICIDAFSKYCAIVPVKSKNESELALGFVECMNKMGGSPKVIMTDGEGGINNSGLFQKYFQQHKITYIPTKGHPHMVERMIRTFKDMLDKRIKPGMQWTELIYPILLTYNNKLIHSTIQQTPNNARKEENELETYINIKLHAKHSRKYPAINIGDNVKIYKKKKLFDKSHVSRWTDQSYKVEDITRSHGITFYKTTARERPFLRHEILKSNS